MNKLTAGILLGCLTFAPAFAVQAAANAPGVEEVTSQEPVANAEAVQDETNQATMASDPVKEDAMSNTQEDEKSNDAKE
ncbi:hypothetical protein PTE30175_00852 [Pandoraea terrae]|uniref:Uncharacterized protein n=1 Tax=Pandoraea terrae TaxID=1537710 RepID=A0A5E4SNY4_9BURK|nr:hypothetical protein [Pandoraea terrae]VVD76801.1 hypothetical protein PTE30175_00852 [Pandoraea terrae]